MIIDSHLHADLGILNRDNLLKYMNTEGIYKAWLLSWEEHDPLIPNYIHLHPDSILEQCQRHPGRLVPFYAPDPLDPGLEQKLKWFKEKGFKGFGELKVSMQWNDRQLYDYLSRVREIRPLLIFHMEKPSTLFSFSSKRAENRINYGLNGLPAYMLGKVSRGTGLLERQRIDFPGYLTDMEKLTAVLEQFREISFVAHGPEFWRQFGQNPPSYLHHPRGPVRGKGIIWQMLEEHGNLYCDLSGYSAYNALSRNLELSAEFLRRFSNKILYGTDNTGLPLRKLLQSTGMDRQAERRIMGENALRLAE